MWTQPLVYECTWYTFKVWALGANQQSCSIKTIPCLNSYVGKCLKYPWRWQCFASNSSSPLAYKGLEHREVDCRAFSLHNTSPCCPIYSVLHCTPPCFAAVMTKFPLWHAWPSGINKVNLMLPYLILPCSSLIKTCWNFCHMGGWVKQALGQKMCLRLSSGGSSGNMF